MLFDEDCFEFIFCIVLVFELVLILFWVEVVLVLVLLGELRGCSRFSIKGIKLLDVNIGRIFDFFLFKIYSIFIMERERFRILVIGEWVGSCRVERLVEVVYLVVYFMMLIKNEVDVEGIEIYCWEFDKGLLLCWFCFCVFNDVFKMLSNVVCFLMNDCFIVVFGRLFIFVDFFIVLLSLENRIWK